MRQPRNLNNGDQKAAIYTGSIINSQRREGDSNPRDAYDVYTLSRCAPSSDKLLKLNKLHKDHS